MRTYHSSSSVLLKRTSLKPFILFSLSVVIALFLFSALLTALDTKFRFASSVINEWSSSLTSEALLHVIGFENPYFTQVLPESSELPPISSLSLELATSVKPGDIRSLLGNELPGFDIYDSEIIVAGEGTNYTNLTHESPPPVDVMVKEREVAMEKLRKLNQQADDKTVTSPAQTTGDKNVVYIYATHDTESFLPLLKDVNEPGSAHSGKVNITDIAERLGKELERRGIGTIVNEEPIQKTLKSKGMDYTESYKVSRSVVSAALDQHQDVQLVFDIHRDGTAKDITTATINGKKYARVMFVVGEGNPEHKKNEHLATTLHHMLEDRYPGLSRGVEGKNKDEGNGVYNQDLSDEAILIEIGGVHNSMKELYHTTEVLAETITQYYWDKQKTEKVSG